MGGRAAPRVTPAAAKPAPVTKAVVKKPGKKPVKGSDCDTDDLIEGDIADCGARALPGAIAGAAVTGAAVASTVDTSNTTTYTGTEFADIQNVSTVQTVQAERHPNYLLWGVLIILALVAAAVVASRLSARRH